MTAKLLSSINICFIHRNLGIGGAEKIRFLMLKELIEYKDNISICCLKEKGYLGSELEKIGFKVSILNVSDRFFNIWAIIKIIIYLNKVKPAIVQTSLFSVNLLVRIVSVFKSIPILICEEHSMTERYNKKIKKIILKLHRNLAKKADCFIACCEAVSNLLVKEEKLPPNKVRVLHNAIDLKEYPSPYSKRYYKEKIDLPESFIAIHIGAYRPLKNQEFLLRVWSHLRFKRKLLLIGEGPSEKYLKKLAYDLKISNEVLFIKTAVNIKDYLLASDILLLPSLSEALPMVILEALAASIPCIVNDVGGTKEIIDHGENGYLLEVNDEEKFVHCIEKLFYDETLRKKMSINARDRVEKKFCMQTYIAKLMSIYSNLLDQNNLNYSIISPQRLPKQ